MKKAIVTGATSGIGLEVCKLLLENNIEVMGVARSEEKVAKAKAYFENVKTKANIHFVMGDLSSIHQVSILTQNLISKIEDFFAGSFDLMFHVAGMVSSGYHENEDGNELTFAVNHLSIFQLTLGLVPYLSLSQDPRMLVVSSKSHYKATININNPQSKRMYNIIKAYMRSKTYNVLFVKGFNERYPLIKSYAIDPGLVNTELGLKNTSILASFIWNWRRKKGTDALFPTKFMMDIALLDEYLNQSGHYFLKGKSVMPNPLTLKPDLINWLWNYSEDLLKQANDKKKR